MDDRNLLLVTVYIICVTYVLYRMVKSLNITQVTIQLNQELLNTQLEEQNLKDILEIQFKLKKRYLLEDLKELSISIKNKSQQDFIEIDWDRSTLTDFQGQSRRVIRITPTMQLDLSERQVFRVIAAGNILTEKLTVEDVLKGDATNPTLKISAPLFDLSKLRKGKDTQKKLYSDFMTRNRTLQFSLKLVLRVANTTIEVGRLVNHILSCEFIVSKVPWTESLSWKPKDDD
ncbi:MULTISPECIES: hypothetical protein [Cyanophyceae]|uniref:hypothetical protein n=1 Tax=Cyanophyceae TaxID=3028117 RepID=UPI0016894AC8|nr:hypothetical protein [Trichocoleus sp. FACHB-69]MBD1932309.1 hypothetical protein [Trichocoleus sp. FACHB-69]